MLLHSSRLVYHRFAESGYPPTQHSGNTDTASGFIQTISLTADPEKALDSGSKYMPAFTKEYRFVTAIGTRDNTTLHLKILRQVLLLT